VLAQAMTIQKSAMCAAKFYKEQDACRIVGQASMHTAG
jgi:hypothetical protein